MREELCKQSNMFKIFINQDIHKSPLYIAVNSQNVCVKACFIGWPEGFLGDGKNNENHHGPYHFTTA